MAKYTNSTNDFGPTPYLVGATFPATYKTVQAAVTAAGNAGGGTVYIQPGTYVESLTIPANVYIIGITTPITSNIINTPSTSYTIWIIGNHTFSASGTSSFENILFSSISGTALFTLSGSSGARELDISYCQVDPTLNSITNGGCFSVSATSGSSLLVLTGSIANATVAPLSIGANGSVICKRTILTSNYVNSAANVVVILSSASASLISSGSTYNTSNAVSQVCPAISFTANASVSSTYDTFICYDSSGYYARANAAATGSFSYAYNVYTGTAGSLDPQITQIILLESPAAVPLSNGQLLIGSSGQIPSLGNLTPGKGIAITNGAGSIAIATSGGTGLTWQTISSNQTLAVSNGYIVTSGAVSLALPTTSVVGDVIVVTLDTGTSWTVTQAAGQQIRISSVQTTSGTVGSVASSALGDSIALVCTIANTRWMAYTLIGNVLTT